MSTEGFDELVRKLESMGKAGNIIANTALKQGAAIILNKQKQDSPKDTTAGSKELKVGKIKTAKSSKNKYVQVGIVPGIDFQKAKGIYFQNYGYKNHRTGRYHASTLWIDKSFEKVKEKAMSKVLNILQREMKL